MDLLKIVDISDLDWLVERPTMDGECDIQLLHNNGLLSLPRDQQELTICDITFNAGIGFLKAWQYWIDHPSTSNPTKRLTYIAPVQNHLTRRALASLHGELPNLQLLSKQLVAAWPPPTPGFHLRSFMGGKVNLLMLQGETVKSFSNLNAKVDIWHLGRREKNKIGQAFDDTMLEQILRLSRSGSRILIDTPDDKARENLQNAGTELQHLESDTASQQVFIGTIKPSLPTKYPGAKWAAPGHSRPKDVAIIGAGVAGSFLADALIKKGISCTLFCSESRSTASKVPAAVLSPKFVREMSPMGRFIPSSYFHAIENEYIKHAMLPGGLMILPSYGLPQERLDSMFSLAPWDDEQMRQNSDGSLFIAQSGCVDTETMLKAMHHKFDITNATISDIRPNGDGWQLLDKNGDIIHSCDAVVFAAGYQDKLHSHLAPMAMHANRGQTSLIPAEELAEHPAGSIAFGGYLSPTIPGSDNNDIRLLGSSFDRWNGDDWQNTRPQDHLSLTDKLAEATGLDSPKNIPEKYWIGRRANTADHFPVIGPVPDWPAFSQAFTPMGIDAKRVQNLPRPPLLEGVYVLSGLGSLGFQYAPLLAEALVAEMTGGVMPIETPVRDLLHPARDTIRRIIRGQKTL